MVSLPVRALTTRNMIKRLLSFPVLLAFAIPATAAITLTCDPNVDTARADLCASMNATAASLYNKTFTNANANIYVKFGKTGLGASTTITVQIPFSTFVAALTASKNGAQATALPFLNSLAAPLYGAGAVSVSSALAWTLGIPNIPGLDAKEKPCTKDAPGCYAGIITLTDEAGAFYFRSGTQTRISYDIFTTVEHEIDEVLGVSSCIDTNGPILTNPCGTNVPAALDLFRYSAPGKLVLISATPGHYFSIDGGVSNAAPGVFFNTLADGSDYHDFIAPCPAPAYHVQDATGCPGTGGGVDITNDGGIEITILNSIGYSLAAPAGGAPTISANGVVPVYSTVTTIQSGEWISIYGTNLAASTVVWNGDFPTTLGGTSVTVNNKPAYLWYVSPTQINLQVPNDVATGTVPIVVKTAGNSVTSTATLAQVAPSFSLLDAKHVTGIILRSNGSGAYGGGTYDIVGPTGTSLGYRTVAAKTGDSVVLFAVGFGPTSPAVPAGQVYSGAAATTNPVNLRINNVPVTPAFAGLSSAGLYQMNMTIPAGLGTGDVPLVASVGGAQTQSTVVISLQ